MFDVKYSKQSVNFLKSAEKKLTSRILKKIETLTENPIQHDFKVVEGYNEKLFRIRVGDYRILYEINYKNNMSWKSPVSRLMEVVVGPVLERSSGALSSCTGGSVSDVTVKNPIYLLLNNDLYQEIHEKLQECRYFHQVLSNMQYDNDHKGESEYDEICLFYKYIRIPGIF
jgi:mRNA interferase RelE/StbE